MPTLLITHEPPICYGLKGLETPVGCQATGRHFLSCRLCAQLLGLGRDQAAWEVCRSQAPHSSMTHLLPKRVLSHYPALTLSWAWHLTSLDLPDFVNAGRLVMHIKLLEPSLAFRKRLEFAGPLVNPHLTHQVPTTL